MKSRRIRSQSSVSTSTDESPSVHIRRSFGLLFLAACGAQKPDPLRAFLDEAEAAGNWNGVALVAEKGEVVLEHGTARNDATGIPGYSVDIAFPIASVAKTLTATAILQLAQEGKLSVDAPVASLLAGFPYPNVTVRHLLSHTSGLPPYNAYLAETLAAHPDTVFHNADLLAAMIAHPVPLRYLPGTDGNYDNVNYLVLALVIEQRAGVPFQQYIAQHILEPAGMRDTRFLRLAELLDDSTVAAPRLFPHLYSAAAVSVATIPYVVAYWRAYRFEGFGDYVSTVHDLLRYHQALESGRLVDTTLLRRAYAPVPLVNGRDNPGRFGLGWEVKTDSAGGLVVSHSGAATGLSIAFVRDLANDRVIVVFDNGHYSADQVASALRSLRQGEAVAAPRRDLTRYLGTLLLRAGKDSAMTTFARLHADSAHWATSEDNLNLLGYDLMGSPGTYQLPVEHRYTEAAAVFELNTRLYPKSWNVWDSYGEALAVLDHRDSALTMYRKALELNPGNPSSTAALERLRGTR